MSFSLADFIFVWSVLERKACALCGHVYLGSDKLEGIIRKFSELTTTLDTPEKHVILRPVFMSFQIFQYFCLIKGAKVTIYIKNDP